MDKYKFYQANEKDLDNVYELLKKLKLETTTQFLITPYHLSEV